MLGIPWLLSRMYTSLWLLWARGLTELSTRLCVSGLLPCRHGHISLLCLCEGVCAGRLRSLLGIALRIATLWISLRILASCVSLLGITLLRVALLGIALLRITLLGVTLLWVLTLRIALLGITLLRILLRITLLGILTLHARHIALLGIARLTRLHTWLATQLGHYLPDDTT